MLVLQSLAGLHRTSQHQLFQYQLLGLRLRYLWCWMVCLDYESSSFSCFWACSHVLNFRLFCSLWGLFHFFSGFLPTWVDIVIIWIKFSHSLPFYVTDSWDIDIHFCHLLRHHFQFTLIHGPNIPGLQYCSYSIGLYFHHQTHPQLSFISTLSQLLHSFWGC